MFNLTENGGTQEKRDKLGVQGIVGIALCVILIPILVMNCFLIVQSLIKPDEVPTVGGYAPMIVLTGSMENTIMKGDLIFCKTVDAESVNEGDVISFFDPEGNGTSVITHRVIKKLRDAETGKLEFRTQGDNNNVEDRPSVTDEHLIAKWSGIRIPLLGYAVWAMQTVPGALVCIGVPIAAFVLYELVSRKRTDSKKQSELDALKAELDALKAAKSGDSDETENGEKPEDSEQ